MENNIITPERQKGLLFGSLLSAAINATTGRNTRDSLARAALGGMQAYSGGLNSIYDMEQATLEIKRKKDLIEAARLTQDWAVEDRPIEVEKNKLALDATKQNYNWAVEDRPYNVSRRNLAIEAAKQNINNMKLQGDSTKYNIASKWIPIPNVAIPEEKDRLTSARNQLAIDIQKDPSMQYDSAKMDARVKELTAILNVPATEDQKSWWDRLKKNFLSSETDRNIPQGATPTGQFTKDGKKIYKDKDEREFVL